MIDVADGFSELGTPLLNRCDELENEAAAEWAAHPIR
jgi:hypothetical protein